MKPLTIGQVARRAGISVETIRFYQREGLLEQPARTGSGYRQYQEDVVIRLRFIGRAKDLGFTLKEIRELLALRLNPGTTCEEVKKKAEEKIADVEQKIHSLRQIKKSLQRLAGSCSGRGPISECPILEALEPEDQN